MDTCISSPMENFDSDSKLQSRKTSDQMSVGGSNFNVPCSVGRFRRGLSSLDSNGIPSLGSLSSLSWPRSSLHRRRLTWECEELGLSIINSLTGDTVEASGALDLHEQKTIVFGSQVKGNTISATYPDHVSLETPVKRNYQPTPGEKVLATQSKLVPVPVISSQAQAGPIPVNHVKQSEDYTCRTSYGPNPRTTHVFGSHLLECNINEMAKGRFGLAHLDGSSTHLSKNLLRRCYMCKKKLDGEDIYMYRDEGFCSPECRGKEIYSDASGENCKKKSFVKRSHSSSLDDVFIKNRSTAK